ncbi:hypothetical protein Mth01_28640 [Sphaerimonospora thailandensis]|uniref:Uncharacterized protein n=1 Tax=Sphaerimonospora thailandensis TaxID=795644 RepID=A0A8J3RA77_9ACTN|nr:hypothetical protein Mth01_28640 [Sphaerimonospora thailandensis]
MGARVRAIAAPTPREAPVIKAVGRDMILTLDLGPEDLRLVPWKSPGSALDEDEHGDIDACRGVRGAVYDEHGHSDRA